MHFDFRTDDALPPLAWLAIVETAAGRCRVEHGRQVETSDTFFVEGAWPGPFAEGRFHLCESFFGSGAVRLSTGDLIFVPSSTTVDYLYHRIFDGDLYVSNSLPFLLAAIDDSLLPFEPAYTRINDSIMDGIVRYERVIPTERGSVRRLMHENLVLRDGKIIIESKPLPPAFSDYGAYRDFLFNILGSVMCNVRDEARKIPLKVLSTQSTGYDSTAINAVAREFGIDTTLSIAEQKEASGYYTRRKETRSSDYGDEIARYLGFDVTPIDRRYFERNPQSEFLSWSTVHCNPDMNLNQIEQFVGDGAILLTGVLGEIWYNAASTDDLRTAKINSELERWDLSGHGVSETRLHVGYIHVAAPYIGARARTEIFRISNSEAMEPWSIGGTYDRPIARRLGEEAGVPRMAFGQDKRATVVEIMPPYLPLGAPLRSEFFNFLKERIGPVRYVYVRVAPLLNAKAQSWYHSPLRKKLRELLRQWPRLGRLIEVPRFADRYTAVLYAYCVNKTKRVYRDG